MSLSDLVVCVGEVTLVAGVATVSNSAIQANDVAILTTGKALGAAYVSAPSYSATTASGSLVIRALDNANPSAAVATDVSLMYYAVLRPMSLFRRA